jgi:hypothetical protein
MRNPIIVGFGPRHAISPTWLAVDWMRVAIWNAMPELKLLFLQMAAILTAVRLMAVAFRFIGQPHVMRARWDLKL